VTGFASSRSHFQKNHMNDQPENLTIPATCGDLARLFSLAEPDTGESPLLYIVGGIDADHAVHNARQERFLLPEKHKGLVVTSDDLTRVKPIRTTTSVSGLKHSREPILAAGKVRFVGEIVAGVRRSLTNAPSAANPRTRSATHRLFRFPPTLMAWPYRTVKPLAQFEPKWLE
jgi:hypothetical protein